MKSAQTTQPPHTAPTAPSWTAKCSTRSAHHMARTRAQNIGSSSIPRATGHAFLAVEAQDGAARQKTNETNIPIRAEHPARCSRPRYRSQWASWGAGSRVVEYIILSLPPLQPVQQGDSRARERDTALGMTLHPPVALVAPTLITRAVPIMRTAQASRAAVSSSLWVDSSEVTKNRYLRQTCRASVPRREGGLLEGAEC